MIVEAGGSLDEAAKDKLYITRERTLTIGIADTPLGFSNEDGDVWLPGHLSDAEARTAVLLTDLSELGLEETAQRLVEADPDHVSISRHWWAPDPKHPDDDERMVHCDESMPGAEPFTFVVRS